MTSAGVTAIYGLKPTSNLGSEPPSKAHYPPDLSKSFSGPHTGCGLRRHNNLVLVIHRYRAESLARKYTGHITTKLNHYFLKWER